MNIVFIDSSEISFNSNDKYKSKLRGGETILINLAEKLADINNHVTVINNCTNQEQEGLPFWQSF